MKNKLGTILFILLSCISVVTFAQAPNIAIAASTAAVTTATNNTANRNSTNPAAATKTTAGSQQAMQAAQQANAAVSQNQNMSKQAFVGMVGKQLPMSTKQIKELRQAFESARQAAATPAGIPPRPTTSSIIVSLSPNAAPPVVRLEAGYISSLVFVDSSGQPWPIKAYSVGNPNAFNIQWDHRSNTLLVQATSFYKRSNLAVMLEGLDTPIMITLLAGQGAVDYRVDLRVPGIGPNATVATASLPNATDPVLLDVLNGVPPKNARTLKVLGNYPCQAWLLHDKLYLRTPLVVISPGWQSIMTSIDGTHAYELQPTSVVLALQHGKDRQVKLILEGLD